MSANVKVVPDQWKPTHDVGGQADKWSFKFYLNPGDQIRAALVHVVDDTNTPIGGTGLTIFNVSFGQFDGDVWEVTFEAVGGSPGYYRICCTMSTDISVSPTLGTSQSNIMRCIHG